MQALFKYYLCIYEVLVFQLNFLKMLISFTLRLFGEVCSNPIQMALNLGKIDANIFNRRIFKSITVEIVNLRFNNVFTHKKKNLRAFSILLVCNVSAIWIFFSRKSILIFSMSVTLEMKHKYYVLFCFETIILLVRELSCLKIISYQLFKTCIWKIDTNNF